MLRITRPALAAVLARYALPLVLGVMLAASAVVPLAARTGRIGGLPGKARRLGAASRPASFDPLLVRPGLLRSRSREGLASWRVGVQAGHWNIEELPDELERLRSSTGARFRDLQEAQLNLGIARRVAALLQAAGVAVDLLPATVPAGYTADAFVSIHADGAARAGVRGWKAAASWRASAAGRRLRDAIAETYARYTGLPEDRFGTTFNMKGYYAFSPHRARHAISQHTPAVIIETGFLTVREDREVLAGRPEDVSRGIAYGVLLFLDRYDPFDREALAVPAYPIMRVAVQRVPLAVQPDPEGRTAGELTEGTLVRPMYRSNGWVEVVVWGNFHVFGWLPEKSLEPLPGVS